MSEYVPWGYHLMVDASKCEKNRMTDRNNVVAFAKELVREIDMVAFGEPQVEHFGKDDKAGFTLVQLIETSNICAHFCDESRDIYLDIFSCKPFDQKVALGVFRKYFLPTKTRVSFLERKAP